MRHKIVPLIISIGLIVLSLYNLIYLKNEYDAEESYYEEISTNFVIKETKSERKDMTEAPIQNNEIDIGIEVNFKDLQSQYKDVIGWIYCEGTQINYPIMQGEDNSYYLRRTIDGKESYAGSIFMDFTNSPDFSDGNTILYGHNMKNNSMFGLIPDYINGDMYNKHPVCYILTKDANYEVEFIGGTSVKVGSEVYTKDSRKVGEFIKNNSVLNTSFNKEINENDKLITLSTCVYGKDNYRYALVGILTPVE